MLVIAVCLQLCYLIFVATFAQYGTLIQDDLYEMMIVIRGCRYFMRALYKSFELHSSFSCSMISNRSLRTTRRVL